MCIYFIYMFYDLLQKNLQNFVDHRSLFISFFIFVYLFMPFNSSIFIFSVLIFQSFSISSINFLSLYTFPSLLILICFYLWLRFCYFDHLANFWSRTNLFIIIHTFSPRFSLVHSQLSIYCIYFYHLTLYNTDLFIFLIFDCFIIFILIRVIRFWNSSFFAIILFRSVVLYFFIFIFAYYYFFRFTLQ